MRYWLLTTALALVLVNSAATQGTKTTDTGKDPKTTAPKEPKEPKEVLGKSFEKWRADLKSTDPTKRENAMKAITGFGPNKSKLVLPDILADLLRHKTQKVDLSVRVNGMMAISTILGGLQSLKKEPDPKHLKSALAVYRMALKDDQVIMRVRALQGLLYLGPIAREAIDDVLDLVHDPVTWEVRKEAIPVLMVLAQKEKAPVHPKAIPALRKVLEDNSHQVKYAAVVAIATLGQDTVLADLRKLVTDPSLQVRVTAVQYIGLVGKAKALPDLRKAMKDPTTQVRVMVVQVLPHAVGMAALVDIRKALDDPSKDVRLTSLQMITQFKEYLDDPINKKEKSITVIMLNKRLDKEPDSIVNMWIHAAIMTITNVNKVHMDPIIKRIHHKDVPVRLQALQIIAMGGKASKPIALNAVLKAIHEKDMDLNVKVTAMQTLVPMRAHEAVPALQKIADDKMAPQALREAAEDVIDGLTVIHAQDSKKAKDDKKKPGKK
ncbi:MAG: HEAT repeat domain-containing protein [Planctomycetes bacterium]|nr:HEAT repeat domain-containing protein [Planctomycetota bacterium]